MSWEIGMHDTHNVILLTYSGHVSQSELLEAFLSALALSRQAGTSCFLADCTGLDGGHSAIDLYQLISFYEQEKLYGLKEAIILPQLAAAQEYVEFYEVACRNRGFDVRIFSERGTALAWLMDAEPTRVHPPTPRQSDEREPG